MTSLSLTPDVDLERSLERHRRELTGYCYRMLGSPHEAEDAVQETLVRAWLYRIATNVCLDELAGRKRRALPMDLGPAASSHARLGPAQPETAWVQPIPDRRVVPADNDPAELALARDSLRLAFVAALQHLRPRQRAALILSDVLCWKVAEVANLLGLGVAATDSLLRRARSTMAAADVDTVGPAAPATGEPQQALLARYVDAFARADVDGLVALVHEDATLSMPPFALWLRGRDILRRWLLAGNGTCGGYAVAVPETANGSPVCADYRPTEVPGRWAAFALHVLDISGGRVRAIHAYLDPGLFPRFGMPAIIEVGERGPGAPRA